MQGEAGCLSVFGIKGRIVGTLFVIEKNIAYQ